MKLSKKCEHCECKQEELLDKSYCIFDSYDKISIVRDEWDECITLDKTESEYEKVKASYLKKN